LFVDFLFELRRRRVPVGTQEAVALAKALQLGLHDSSLDGFYNVAKSLLVHSEAHLDAFDQAFASHFRGVEQAGLELTQNLLDWLREARERLSTLSPEERAVLDAIDFEELQRQFEERLKEQKERHDGGNRWIGTGGTSPFGHSGAARKGIRVGGPGGNRSAVRVAEQRNYAAYRDDQVLDIRQLQVALRKLRAFAREGHPDELDLDATVSETARNAGELEVVTRPPRRPNTRVILMMDVGGSMDPYADLVSRLFSAASKATHFKELRTYYFHNCIYGRVYNGPLRGGMLSIPELLAQCGPHYKLILVGDALMGPYELLLRGGGQSWDDDDAKAGLEWLVELSRHFEKSVWLNPEPASGWGQNTISEIRQVFPMFPLTVHGLGDAVAHLTRGKGRVR
jgi:uncharacterized protein